MKKTVYSTAKGKRKPKKILGFFNPDFFKSKNARLVVILLIAAVIPITVLGVQKVQNLQQEAKAPNMCNGGATGLLVEPNPADDGADITLTHTGAFPPIDQSSFDNDDFTGNGAVGCTFDAGSSSIKCKAKYNSKSKKDISDHTWTYHGVECNYQVKKPVKPTKDPNVTPTRRPPTTPKPGSGCQANLSANNCTANNKPRLRASWDMKDEDKGCSVRIAGIQVSTECSNSNMDNTELDGKILENGKTYEIVISNGGSCNPTTQVTAKAPTCAGGYTPAPSQPTNTPKPGQATNTPAPGQATPTPKSSGQINPPTITRASCISDNGKLKLITEWNKPDSSIQQTDIKISKGGLTIFSQNDIENAPFTFDKNDALTGLKTGNSYAVTIYYKKGVQTSQSTKQSNACPSTGPTPTQAPGSMGAGDSCAGGVCF